MKVLLYSYDVLLYSYFLAHSARDVVMVQGGWATEGGAASYLMPTLNHAMMVANAIHDNKSVPTDYLVHAFNAGTNVGGNCQS